MLELHFILVAIPKPHLLSHNWLPFYAYSSPLNAPTAACTSTSAPRQLRLDRRLSSGTQLPSPRPIGTPQLSHGASRWWWTGRDMCNALLASSAAFRSLLHAWLEPRETKKGLGYAMVFSTWKRCRRDSLRCIRSDGFTFCGKSACI